MKDHSEKFSLPTSSAESKKIQRQENCEHNHWRKVCSDCGKQFESEVIHSVDIAKDNEVMI